MPKIKNIRDFDTHFTCNMFGFTDPDDYYTKASSRYFMDGIKKPLFCLNARDDPLISEHNHPIEETNKNPNILFGTTRGGGHIGYLAGTFEIRQWFTTPVFEYFNTMRATLQS